MTSKICFRCKKYINDNDHYYSFTEFLEGKEVNTDYAHKDCWDKIKDGLSDKEEAMGMLRQLKGSLKKLGVLPEEEYVVT